MMSRRRMTSSTHDSIIVKKAPVKGNFVQAIKDHIKLIGYPPLSDVQITAEKYSNAGPVRYAYTIAVQHNDFQGYNRDENAWVKSVSEFYDTNKRKSIDGVLMFKIALNRGAVENTRKFKKNPLRRKVPLTEEEIAKTWARSEKSNPSAKVNDRSATSEKKRIIKVKEVSKEIPSDKLGSVTLKQNKYGVLLVSAVGREALITHSPGAYVDSDGKPLDYSTMWFDRTNKKNTGDIDHYRSLRGAVGKALAWVRYWE